MQQALTFLTFHSCIFSCVSGMIGNLCGNLMSPLSPAKQTHAEGPAFSHGSLRAGSTLPSKLRGPVCSRPNSLAMQLHTRIPSAHMCDSKGKSYLHELGLPLGTQDDKGLRSPVSAFMTGWMWWFMRDSACCSLLKYCVLHTLPSSSQLAPPKILSGRASGGIDTKWGGLHNNGSVAYAGHAASISARSAMNFSTSGYVARRTKLT